MSTKIVESLALVLDDENDWENRVKAMSDFEQNLSSYSLELSEKDILIIRPHITNQITDNKTSVCKKACEMVATLV